MYIYGKENGKVLRHHKKTKVFERWMYTKKYIHQSFKNMFNKTIEDYGERFPPTKILYNNKKTVVKKKVPKNHYG